MIAAVVKQYHELFVFSAGRIDEMDSLVCIYPSSRFGNCAVTFRGFSGIGSRCKIIFVMDGVITTRFTNCALSIRTLIHKYLINVEFGHGNGYMGGFYERDCMVSPGKLTR